ncbi:MAG: histidine phosphatase family protein [Gammaproteobacteria bacterium]|nr:histidine phosphatase family protein [Gammaproteobacteria bacterium]
MKLIIVRHGVTDFNLQRRIQGQLDTRLNNQGERQAEELGHVLSEENIDKIYSSDLQRSVATTAAIIRAGGNLPVEYSPDLRERHYGEFQGGTVHTLMEAVKAHPHWESFEPEGGESLQAFHARAGRFWQAMLERHDSETLLISTHGGVAKSLIAHILARDLKFRAGLKQQNCCVNILQRNAAGDYTAVSLNDVTHLSNPSLLEGI